MEPLESPLRGCLGTAGMNGASSKSDLFLKCDVDHLGSCTDSFIAFTANGSKVFKTSSKNKPKQAQNHICMYKATVCQADECVHFGTTTCENGIGFITTMEF